MGKKARRAALAARGSHAVELARAALPDVDAAAAGYVNPGVNSDNLSYSPFATLGSVGTLFFNGLITGEEYNPELSGDKLLRTTQHMWRSSPQIAALVAVQMLPLVETKKTVVPASNDPADVRVAQFVQDNLFGGLQRSFEEVDEESTLEWLRDGFSLLEKVYSPPDPDDGLIRLRKLAPRIPRSIYRWYPNQDDDLDRVQQRVWATDDTGMTGQYVFPVIPASKLVRFTHQQEGNNFAGTSVLRPAYKPWFMLDQLERLACVAAERMAAGVPVFSEPQGPVQKSDRDLAASTLMSLHAHEKAYILEPYGWAFRFEAATGMNLMPLIEYFSLQIVRSVLAQFLNLDRGGSYALSLDISGFFLQALQAKLRYRLNVWNNQVIRPLVDLNFDVERYPAMVADKLDKRDVDKFMVGLAAILPWLTKDAPTENAVRELLELPDLAPEATPAGGGEPTVDTDSQGQGPSNEAGTDDATSKETDKADAAGASEGAALALPAWLQTEVDALLTAPPADMDAGAWRAIVLETARQEAAA